MTGLRIPCDHGQHSGLSFIQPMKGAYKTRLLASISVKEACPQVPDNIAPELYQFGRLTWDSAVIGPVG